jgi:hypothetical protein
MNKRIKIVERLNNHPRERFSLRVPAELHPKWLGSVALRT